MRFQAIYNRESVLKIAILHESMRINGVLVTGRIMPDAAFHPASGVTQPAITGTKNAKNVTRDRFCADPEREESRAHRLRLCYTTDAIALAEMQRGFYSKVSSITKIEASRYPIIDS